MRSSEVLVEKIGGDIPAKKKQEVARQIEQALRDNTFVFIERDGHPIGFFTYFMRDDKVLVNNCYIFKEYREKSNLLRSRHKIRRLGKPFYFTNGKRKRRSQYAPKRES